MSVRKLSRSLVRAAATAQQTAGHCNTTIGARLPILFGGPSPLTAEALAEWNQAYTEKVEAAWEGAFAAAAEWQATLIKSAFRMPTPVALADDFLRAVHKGGDPARRRVKANAKRLTKDRAKRGA